MLLAPELPDCHRDLSPPDLPASAAVQLPEYTAGLPLKLRQRPDCQSGDGFSVGKARDHSARRESDEEDDWPAVAVAHVVQKLRRQLIGRCCRSDVVLKLNEF
ncbi:unnamed protein product [Boreogadus saida]